MLTVTWNTLSPKLKRWLVIIGVSGVLIGTIYLFSPSDTHRRKEKQSDPIRHILTDTNTRDVSINSLSANIKRLEEKNELLKREFERLKRESIPNSTTHPLQTEENQQLKQELASMKDEMALLKQQSRQRHNESASVLSDDPTMAPVLSTVQSEWSELDALMGFETHSQSTALTHPSASSINPSGESIDTPNIPGSTSYLMPRATQIRVIEGEKPVIVDELIPEAPRIYLPAGSIIAGTLITGLDAPTHDSARREPFPALLRIQREAILPNHFRADIKECFLIAGGYGDLSSERAYLRGETISCITESGEAIEVRLDAYAAGEDGKAGIRGRLVSKQGQLVAKSMMAGFLQGLAGAFDVNPVPTINTNNLGNSQLYQSVMSSDALQGAAMKGTSKALDRIAKFYLDMAENMFPVIEIDAARQIEFIVTRGTSL